MNRKEQTHFSNKRLSIGALNPIYLGNSEITLDQELIQKVERCRNYLNQLSDQESDIAIYGINTGFGSLCNVQIAPHHLEELQYNLVVSHACGFGDCVPIPVVRLMIALKIKSLSQGNSGISLPIINRLKDQLNKDVLPVIFTEGSLGASGDLAPLAHMSLPLLGLGEVYVNKERRPSAEALREFGWTALSLQSKEGLALLNGTQFMSAYGSAILLEWKNIQKILPYISAMSLDAFDCKQEPFHPLIHSIRPHQGQQIAAAEIREILKDSDIAHRSTSYVQDPYSFRCIPQVHGASYDAISHVEDVIEREINSVTDNPNIFESEDQILSGGNFHGQPLALALDYMKIALAEIGNISERRTYNLISGTRNLPAFLIQNPGLQSGFMIPQYTAASIVSKNKQLASPASIDSIPSSNGQEDHVSMGANAAVQAYDIVQNVKKVLAIELLTAAQAFEFRRPATSSEEVEVFYENYREVVPFLEKDVVMHDLMKKSYRFVEQFFRD